MDILGGSEHDLNITLVTLIIGAVVSLLGAIQERKNPLRMFSMILVAIAAGIFPAWSMLYRYIL